MITKLSTRRILIFDRDRLRRTIRAKEKPKRNRLSPSLAWAAPRPRIYPVACRSNKRPQVSQHFAFSRALYGSRLLTSASSRKTEEYTAKKGWARAGKSEGKGWRDLNLLVVGDKEEEEEEKEEVVEATRGEMVRAVTGIIYLTGRETKRTKHCRGVAPQTEPLGEKKRGIEGGGGQGGRNREN